MRSKIPTVLLLAILVSGSIRAADRAASTLKPDYSKIRGCNYVPSYAPNSVAIWAHFDADTIDRELGFAGKLGLNAVRFLLQYVVYEKDPLRFLEDVERFVQLADKHHLKVMFVLFDSCFGN